MRKQYSERERRPRGRKEPLKCFEISIIAGALKGKKLLIPDIHTTRSSKAILRESLFNTLQFDLIDKPFVEVFAGSGSIGLEALSRGASEGIFLERNKQVFEVLRANIAQLGLADKSTAILGDSFEEFPAIYRYIAQDEEKAYFYFDPPFSTREGMEDIYDKTLELIAMIEPESCEMVIVEHISSLDLPEEIGALVRKKRKKFGKSTLSYYLPKNQ